MTTVAYIYLAVGVCMILVGIVMLLLSKRVKKPKPPAPGMIVCTSKDRPTISPNGIFMFETDTNICYYYDGDFEDWVPLRGKHFVKERRLMGPPR